MSDSRADTMTVGFIIDHFYVSAVLCSRADTVFLSHVVPNEWL